jgi:hypothetical protein
MSRGLGSRQRALLTALAELERQFVDPADYLWGWARGYEAFDSDGGWIRAWAVVSQAWDMTWRHEEPAALDALLESLRRPAQRRRSAPAGHIEHRINLTRTLLLLERRGLIERRTVGRSLGGWVRLTDAGREEVAAIPSRQDPIAANPIRIGR